MTNVFEKFDFKKRLKSMVKLDFRRLFTSPMFYIIIGICFVVPILIFVMISMMEGSPMTDQNGTPLLDEFGNPVLMEGFKNVWQMLGSISGGEQTMSMDITSMCNINMIFFAISVLVSLFVGQDFKSGYSKNLFTVRSNKIDYVISKSLVGIVGGAMMILSFFVGMLLGGAIANISFELIDVNAVNVVMCLLSKLGLVLVFVGIFVLMSIIGKGRIWLSLVGGLGISMLLFMMIPIVSPLNATFINVILSFIGGSIFIVGLGIASVKILNKSNLI